MKASVIQLELPAVNLPVAVEAAEAAAAVIKLSVIIQMVFLYKLPMKFT